ncbi:MAG TPA: type II secretion system protein [Geothrix sp.]|jgi:prepilin-type N-terminal cleavage/methylation domain-containing protein
MSGLLSRLAPRRFNHVRGFSLIELLLVIALIGIISAIAIPSFLGQRTRARVIGDAMANAKALAMALESRKAENGLYGTAGTYTWTAAGARPATDIAPSFTPQGNSQMDYTAEIANGGLTYVLSVNNKGGGGLVYQTDQTGKELARQY